MAYRDIYLEIAEAFRKKDEITIETVLQGSRAGEKYILSGRASQEIPEADVYRETLFGRSRAVVCGGGHVSLALVRFLKMLDFSVTVIDEREEFASRERFPEADEICCMDFTECLESRDFGNHAYYIIVTRGHKDDYRCLTQILGRRRDYVGMIGSRKKVAMSFERLRLEGWQEEEIRKIHAPVGLAIGAETPAEIGISIAAEIIREKNKYPRRTLEEDVLLGISDPESAAMVTVIEKTGSSPRGEGTRMVVRHDGSIYGTIGGGPVEYAAIREARDFSGEKGFAVKEYDLSNSSAATLGMVCGGKVTVMFEQL